MEMVRVLYEHESNGRAMTIRGSLGGDAACPVGNMRVTEGQ